MSKSLFRLLTLGMLISIVSAPIRAMEQPLDVVKEQKIVPPISFEMENLVIQAINEASLEKNFEPLRIMLLNQDVTPSQVYFIAFQKSSWVTHIEKEMDDSDSFTRTFLRLLFEFKFNVNELDSKYASSLWQAISSQCIKLARYLIDQGADINIIVNDRSLLMYAIQERLSDIAEFLIERGANIHAKTGSGMTALDFAMPRMAKIATLLVERGAQVDGKHLFAALQMNDIALFELLLKEGAHPNSVDGKSEKPLLHFMSSLQYVVSFAHLMAKKQRAPFNQSEDVIALDQTSKLDLPCMQLLFDYGAHVDLQDDSGSTALMYAAGLFPANLANMILELAFLPDPITHEKICAGANSIARAQLLLAHGANRDLKNSSGMTARDIAKRYGYTAMVELLDTYHPWGEGNHRECLKFRAAQAVLAECKHMSKEEVKEVFQAIPDNIRDVVCLIAPREVKEKIGFKPDFEMVLNPENNNTQNSNNE